MKMVRAWVVLALLCGLALAGELAVRPGEKIGFLGDSITAIGTQHPGGYTRLVMSGLEAMGCKAEPVFAGVGGHKSDDMHKRIARDILAHRPKWMLLSCGVNDTWHAQMRGRRGVPLPEFIDHVTEMVKAAKAAGIEVMLMTATVVYETPDYVCNQQLKAYNAAIHKIAKEHGCRVADVGQAIRAELERMHAAGRPYGTLLTVDGVHMNPLGDAIMAETILRAFGADDADLAKAQAAWNKIPDFNARLGIPYKLTLAQFRALDRQAEKRGLTFKDYAATLLQKALEEALRQGGK